VCHYLFIACFERTDLYNVARIDPFTTESLVVALSASEKTAKILVGVTSTGGSVITDHLTIPNTGTTEFPSASIPGLEIFTSVETSWKYINLST
jgi:hypothetical protein